MSEVTFLYATLPDEDAAGAIASTLVDERLAACVNMIPGMRSVYRWQGKIESDLEIVLICKTTTDRASAAKDRILELHPSDTPCVTAFPVSAAGSNSAFLDWVAAQVSGDA